LALKARLDFLGSLALLDLKTCRSPAPGLFSSQSARLKYHCQMALYNAALIAAGLEPRPVKIVAAQNVAPFDVVVYDVGEDVIIHGERMVEAALDTLAECRETGQWPGLAPDEEMVLRLPMWAVGDEDEWSVVTEEVA
jgi:hypothetical protein